MLIVALEEYFMCEADGTGIECDPSKFAQFTYPEIESVLLIMLGFTPVVNLIFVVNWTASRAVLKSKMQHCKVFSRC